MKPFLPAIGWSLVILILSTKAAINLPESWADLFSWDKIGHLTVYAILTYLLLLGLKKKELAINISAITLTILGSSLYGILMEYLQYSFFPGRYFEMLDILANIIGSFIGLLLFKFLKP